MECLFCRIAEKCVPADIVYADSLAVAFLDHRPLFPGHLLLIPRSHVETLAVESAMEAEGSFVAINNKVSQSVPHLHVHVVPRRKKDGLKGFFWPRGSYRDDAHRESVAAAIRQAISAQTL